MKVHLGKILLLNTHFAGILLTPREGGGGGGGREYGSKQTKICKIVTHKYFKTNKLTVGGKHSISLWTTLFPSFHLVKEVLGSQDNLKIQWFFLSFIVLQNRKITAFLNLWLTRLKFQKLEKQQQNG